MSDAYKPIRDLIGKYESRGDYNIVYGGIPKHLRPAALTNMTVAEVIAWQKHVVAAGAKSSAAGKYQIIRKTLEGLGFPGSAKFNTYTQDAMADALLDRRGFKKFLAGSISAEQMAIALSQEWASFPVPKDMQGATRWVKKGQSYYQGDGLNNAHASVDEVMAALQAAKVGDERPVAKPAPAPTAPSANGGLLASLLAFLARIFGGAPK